MACIDMLCTATWIPILSCIVFILCRIYRILILSLWLIYNCLWSHWISQESVFISSSAIKVYDSCGLCSISQCRYQMCLEGVILLRGSLASYLFKTRLQSLLAVAVASAFHFLVSDILSLEPISLLWHKIVHNFYFISFDESPLTCFTVLTNWRDLCLLVVNIW